MLRSDRFYDSAPEVVSFSSFSLQSWTPSVLGKSRMPNGDDEVTDEFGEYSTTKLHGRAFRELHNRADQVLTKFT